MNHTETDIKSAKETGVPEPPAPLHRRCGSCGCTHHIGHFVDIFSLAQVNLIRLNLDPETFHLRGSLLVALLVDIPKNQLASQLGKPVGQQTPQTTA